MDARTRPAAPRDTVGLEAGAARARERAQRTRRLPAGGGRRACGQSLWIEVYVERDRPAGVYEGTLAITADGKASALPVELRVFDFALPDENSLTVMVYYEPDQPELYQGRNLDAAYHRFAHRHRVELVHAYDEATVEAHRGRFDGTDFTRAAGYEGPGEGIGQHDRARVVLRSRPRLPGEGERVEALRRLDGASWRARSRTPSRSSTCPTSRTRRSTPRSAGSPRTCARTRAPAASCRSSSPSGPCPELDGRDRHLVRARRRLSTSRGRGGGARARAAVSGSTTAARPHGPALAHRRARHRGPRVVAWAAFKHDVDALLLLARRALAAQQPEAGRAERRTSGRTRSPSTTAASRASPSTTRATSTATASCSIRARRSCTPRRTAASRGRSAPCSSPTCAAACRTTST